VCAVCDTKASTVVVALVPDTPAVSHARRVRVVACRDCRPALQHAALAAFAQLDASRELADGRRAGDVAADFIAARMPDGD